MNPTPANSAASAGAYACSCEVVHVNNSTYRSYKGRKSENRIMTARLSSLEDVIKPRGLGLKYVAEGQETYWVQGKRHSLRKGHFLLVNDTVGSFDVQIGDTPTHSVCIDMDVTLVNEQLRELLRPDELDDGDHCSRFLFTSDLLVHGAPASMPLQQGLHRVMLSSRGQVGAQPGVELLYEIAALLVRENQGYIQSYYNLQTAKRSTRQELYRRLLKGKEVLDSNLEADISMQQVAKECCLSESRFFRLFRQCFGESPYHYLLGRRVDYSVQLKQKGHTWADIATLLNFTDLAAFSNCFKKIKGVPPSKAPELFQ
ncbi:helix-turn-helix domain-containing protein [Pontibacter mangrovi]|nr:AraC family transcriptional regulator [Pontibacter mangrovi]